MTEKNEAWGSTIGFILASLGMAIGTGNVWRFPRMVATYGGGPFIFAWLVGLVINQIGGLFAGNGFGFFTVIAIAVVACFIWLLFRPYKEATHLK